MSIIYTVTEKFQQRRASIRNGVKSEVRVYGVKASAIPAGLTDVRDASGVPAYGSSLFSITAIAADADSVCTGKDVAPVASDSKHFDVLVTFETISIDGAAAQIADPMARPIEYEDLPDEREEAYFKDCTSPTPKLVTTTAGEPFENMPTRDAGGRSITIVRNESAATHNPVTQDALERTLNSTEITICGITYGARKCRLKPVRRKYIIEGGYKYWQVTYNILYRTEGWDQKVLDQGYYKLVSNKRVKILDPHNQMYTRPYPLNGSGAPQTNGDTPPAEITFKPYADASWAALNLPTALP